MIDNFKKNFSLKELTTWKVGGVADWVAMPHNLQELQQACRWAKSQQIPITVLSGGSNVLISDQGVEGLVILLTNLNKIISVHDDEHKLDIIAEAGVPKSELLKVFVKHRRAPAVFLAGLPGDVGGGVVMNAGVSHDISPREFHEIVSWIEFVDLKTSDCLTRRLSQNEIQWSYRKSDGWRPGVIWRVGISWSGTSDITVLKTLQESNRRRISTQPLHEPSCGSVFKNPPNHKSGRLIEECGLKGFSVGGAQVSEKHANFIVNKGGATSHDIETLRKYIQDTVKEKTGFFLEPEYLFLGRR